MEIFWESDLQVDIHHYIHILFCFSHKHSGLE